MISVSNELARRIEATEAAAGREYCAGLGSIRPGTGAAAETIAGGVAVYAGAASPLTHALGLGVNGPVSEREFERLEDFYRSRGADVVIELCPFADVSMLHQISSRGYELMEFNNVLVRTLSRYEVLPLTGRPCEIRTVTADEADAWSQAMALGFLSRTEVAPELYEVGSALFRMASGLGWAGLVDGAPLATAAMGIWEGVASFYCDSTLPAFRGRGIQSALIHARLARAIETGCDLAMASVLPGSASQRNYERAGFQTAYTRANFIRRWV